MWAEVRTDKTELIGLLIYRRTCLKWKGERLDRNNTERNRNTERRINKTDNVRIT